MGKNFRLHEKDLVKLYQIKIRKGKSPKNARYEVEMLRRLIKKHGITTPGNSFKFGKDAYLDFDNDGIMNAFDCQPLNPWKQGDEHWYDHKDFSTGFNMGMPTDKYEVITKYMTADEYLTLARQATINPGLDADKTNEEYASQIVGQDRIDKYAAAMKKGDKFPTPFLIYQGNSSVPQAHEGRARSYAFKKAFGAKKKLPVYIIRKPVEF
jgi:hypothetical protein